MKKCLLISLILFGVLFLSGCLRGDKSEKEFLKNSSIGKAVISDDWIMDEKVVTQVMVFKDWATAESLIEKNKYTWDKENGLYKYSHLNPFLSDAYFDKNIKNFKYQKQEVCPLIDGKCDQFEQGSELSFDIIMDKTIVGSGHISFNKDNKIVEYKGPKNDTLPNYLSPENAVKIAKENCERDGLELKESPMRLRLVDNILYWNISLSGELGDNCFAADCSINGNTSEAKVNWSCGGLLP